ncbi:MAG: copper chaperone PCu(A)C [Amphritea sp.]
MQTIGKLYALALAMVLLTLQQPVLADDQMHSGLKVDQPWSRATPGETKVGAAYLMIHNMGQEVDSLVGISTPVADKAEMHTHSMIDGMMSMTQVNSIQLQPGEPTLFKPGSNHIMLIGLKQPLMEGESFKLTLHFEKAGEITTSVPVRGIGAMSSHAEGMSNAMSMEHSDRNGHTMDHSEHKMDHSENKME